MRLELTRPSRRRHARPSALRRQQKLAKLERAAERSRRLGARGADGREAPAPSPTSRCTRAASGSCTGCGDSGNWETSLSAGDREDLAAGAEARRPTAEGASATALEGAAPERARAARPARARRAKPAAAAPRAARAARMPRVMRAVARVAQADVGRADAAREIEAGGDGVVVVPQRGLACDQRACTGGRTASSTLVETEA